MYLDSAQQVLDTLDDDASVNKLSPRQIKNIAKADGKFGPLPSLLLRQDSSISSQAIAKLSATDQFFFRKFGVGPAVELPYTTIHTPFEKQSYLHPNLAAAQDGEETISYAELNAQANRLAHLLADHGIGNNDCVGLFLERSIPMLVGIMGVLKSGGAYVPQHVTVAPRKQMAHIIEAANIKVVLTLEKYLTLLPAGIDCIYLCIDKLMDTQGSSLSTANYRPALPVKGEDRCLILFTSGTTGNPNGVQVTHRNMCNILLTEPGNLGIQPGDKVAQLLSISFDMAAWEILTALAHGGTLLIRGKDFSDTAAEADVIVATPTILSRIDSSRCRNVKTVAVAGEPCPKSLADKWAEFSDFYNSCGPTETTIVNTMGKHRRNQPLTIGVPTPNNTVYILDEHGDPCAIGEVGEMWAGGDCVTAGYLNNPVLTGERYKYDKFLRGKRMMFNTRDLGRWNEDGSLEHLGRSDDQVKVRGFRVELDSVSTVLESIAGCIRAVTLKFDNENLIAFVSPATVDINHAREAVAAKLPYYCMPTIIKALPELPTTSRGKIDKRLLLASITEKDIIDVGSGESEIPVLTKEKVDSLDLPASCLGEPSAPEKVKKKAWI